MYKTVDQKKTHYFHINNTKSLTNRALANLIVIVFLISFTNCSNKISLYDRTLAEIEYAENNVNEMTEKDWENLDQLLIELENDYKENKETFTKEEKSAYLKLQGRHTALLVKKNTNEFQEALNNAANKIEGFIEGIRSKNN